MKVILGLVALVLVASALPAAQQPHKTVTLRPRKVKGKIVPHIVHNAVVQGPPRNLKKLKGATECEVCINFMDQFLNTLLNVILNGGVVGGCSGLCAAIGGSGVEQAVCNLLCDGVGIDAFINLIEWADLDPVWMCEEIDACKKTTCKSNCASISSSSVYPLSTQAGNTVNYTIDFSVNSPDVGVSSIAVHIVDTNPKADGFDDLELDLLLEPQVGRYTAVIPIQTLIQYSDGSTQPFPNGLYNATVMFCEGLCGSNHTGSGEILAQKVSQNFTLRG